VSASHRSYWASVRNRHQHLPPGRRRPGRALGRVGSGRAHPEAQL